MRFIEYLDAIRDRTHHPCMNDLGTVISERIARNSNRLAALAALLLPPSVIAGLFGMNVGGIPGVKRHLGLRHHRRRDAGHFGADPLGTQEGQLALKMCGICSLSSATDGVQP